MEGQYLKGPQLKILEAYVKNWRAPLFISSTVAPGLRFAATAELCIRRAGDTTLCRRTIGRRVAGCRDFQGFRL